MALVMAGIRPAVGLAALILAFVMALRLMTTIKTAGPVTPGGRRSLPAGDLEDAAFPRPDAAARLVPAPAAAKLELADPEITAKVVRAWMGES